MPSSFLNFKTVFFSIIFAAVIFPSRGLKAQADSSLSSSLKDTLRADCSMLWKDAGDLLGAPLHFSKTEWLLTGAAVAGTVLAFTLDESARNAALSSQSKAGDALANVGKEYGREVYGFALSGGMYAGGLALGKRDLRITGILLFESIAAAGITTSVLKSLLGRSRPGEEEGRAKFRFFQFKTGTTSFPSGHATVAFSVSSVLSARIGNAYVTIGLYSLALLTAASRVYNDEHWFSDVLLGSAIGTAAGLTVNSLHDASKQGVAFRLIPGLGSLRAELVF